MNSELWTQTFGFLVHLVYMNRTDFTNVSTWDNQIVFFKFLQAKGSYFWLKHLEQTISSYLHIIETDQAKPSQH